MTVLYLRGMPQALVREAKAAAAREGVTLTRLVSSAIARSLGHHDEPDSLAADIAWYENHRDRLGARYRGQFLAIYGGAVIDHHADFDVLAERVFGRLGAQPVFMPKAGSSLPVRQLRSPRLVRS